MGDPYPELYLDPPYVAPQQRHVDHGQQQQHLFFPDAQNFAFRAAQQDRFNVTWPQATPGQIMQGHQHAGRINNMAHTAPLTDIPNGRAFAPGDANTNMFLSRPGNMQGGLPRLTEMGPAGVQAHDARPRVPTQAPLNISRYTGMPARKGPVAFATPPRSTLPAQARVSTPIPAALPTPVPTPVLSTPVRAASSMAPTAPLTPGIQSNQPPAPSTQKKKRAPSGKGSKSGAGNRRIGGDSDEEMAKLDVKQMKVAGIKTAAELEAESEKAGKGLTETDKLRAVQYIVQPEVWSSFRLHQHTVFLEISTVILKNRVSATQVRNYWHNQAWEKYKAIRTLQKHTGGGDGDEDDGDGAGDEVDGGKKKRSAKDGFSVEVLQDFEKSEIYRLIDHVAHNDETVTRDREYNSATPISDDEESAKGKDKMKKRKRSDSDSENSGIDKAINRALAGIEAKNKRQETADKIQLQLAMKRDQREQEEHEEKLAEVRRKARDERWKQAMDMLTHGNPLVKQKGERMVQELTAEEEAEK